MLFKRYPQFLFNFFFHLNRKKKKKKNQRFYGHIYLNILSQHNILKVFLWFVKSDFFSSFFVHGKKKKLISFFKKSLAHLACKKRESESDDYMIDFDRLVNVPKPHSIMSRLLVPFLFNLI